MTDRPGSWWTYLRRGYSIYFSFPIGMINFTILVYNFVIKQVDWMPLWSIGVLLGGIIFISMKAGAFDFQSDRGSYHQDAIAQTRNHPFFQDFSQAFIKHCLGQDLLAIDLMEKWT